MADSVYSLDEVAKHVSKTDLWISLWNHVYNITDYQEDHPGGKDFLFENAGTDATTAYEDIGHSTDAREILENFRIGSTKIGQTTRQRRCPKSSPRAPTS
jgi:cytochrome-b5 reductase